MKTNGAYNYATHVCTLEIGNPETFESIINLEFKPGNVNLDFEYNSWNHKIYSTQGYSPVTYGECVGVSPLEWNASTVFERATPTGGGNFVGDQNSVRIDTNIGNTYYSLQSSNQGNDPLDEAFPEDPNVGFWFTPPGASPLLPNITWGQERARYKFDEDAKSNVGIFGVDYFFWYLPSCGSGYYTAKLIGVNIKDQLQNQLQNYGFDLHSDWLDYPKNINTLYENKLWLASTDMKMKTTAFELMEIIQHAFNCDYVVKDGLLKFIWEGDRYSTWDSGLPPEHNLESIDIFDWKDSENKDVKRHVLKFTDSILGTHDNSVIEYDNNFIEDANISPNFDVDLTYSINETDTPCLITTDEYNTISKDVALYNPYLVPSLLHETFYFVGREYKTGTFNGNLVTLQQGFFEKASTELAGSYNFDNWDLEFPIKINELTTSPQFAICDEVKYNFKDNNYTLKLRTRN
jgi:hypothetical protein